MHINKKKLTSINNKNIINISLTNDNNFGLSFFNFGGYIDRIEIPYKNEPNKKEDVVLGYKNFDDYVNENSYFNCIIGRVSNRISNSSFFLNNEKHELFNNNNSNHIHGGREGFNKKVWDIVNIEKSSNEIICKLAYLSPDKEEGYPGNLNCEVDYILNNNNEIIIKFWAKTDLDTIVNLTNHNYWNFHGHGIHYNNIIGHKVQILSDQFLEIDDESIPTGNIIKTTNTKTDFKKFKTLQQNMLTEGGFDLCYIVEDNNMNKKVASVYSEITKMGVEIFTDQPSLQFYTGGNMNKIYNGKFNRNYGINYGICIEPQQYVNAINQEKFKNPILIKGKEYKSNITMKLKNDF
ncbi:MAG: galactose mutarotase [Pelagibacteraceae bacterium]|nr:galactose mutarotase [Pelagibacteraceae bacterium]|tara:strand:+ start:1232 stop:2281 length:1050 start_codon:yes stop_codon:yes gene_type:complete